jgi:hypothetical protein
MSTTQPVSSLDGEPTHETLSPLEQEILDEYARLLGNMNKVLVPPFLRAPLKN